MPVFDTTPILEGLNDPQKEAVETADGPILVVAGPGSGKTRVLTCRIAWILATQTARPYQILALTFTNKAAKEMLERVENLLPPGMTSGMWIGTFHAQMARLLRIEAECIGFTRDFTIYDTDDSERIIKQLIEAEGLDLKEVRPRAVRAYISEAKNARMPIEEIRQGKKSRQYGVAVKLFDSYNDALQAANAFDFDDLLLKPLEIFDKHPDILDKYQDKWTHVLIDEYQDTNRVQYALANALAGKYRNLCVVGDDAQSIYSFRGADIRNILSFEKDYPEAKVIRLEQNYRSTKAILGMADAIITHNHDQIQKTLWTNNGTGDPVALIEARSDRDEAKRAVGIIRGERIRNALNYRDFAILYRTNAQSRNFEEALRQEDIPYQIVGGISFYQRKEIKDALAYLRLLVNPGDVSSFQRVINYPRRGIGVKSQERIFHYLRRTGCGLRELIQGDLLSQINLQERIKNQTQDFISLINHHAAEASAGKAAVEVAATIFRESGLLDDLQEDDTLTGQIRLENIYELLRAIQDHDYEEEVHTLSSYLQSVALMTDADEDDPASDRVVLMTLHASKGLEFEVVFIGGMEEGLLPLIRGERISIKDLEEERRLFYVGATRAKSRLYLGWAKTRYRYGSQPDFTTLSSFIDEIKPGTLKKRRASTRSRAKKRDSFPRYRGRQTDRARGASFKENRFRQQAYKPSTSGHVPSCNPSDLSIGTLVSHKIYGEGRVIQLEGSGSMTKAVVDFHSYGMKRLMVSFAPMKVI
ncbi:MAG: UvrD-helicase domain-containing protein [Bacteroidota bacterium]|nr:UvrD-helicase domain-containing protein [Bacteroidota bacterium]